MVKRKKRKISILGKKFNIWDVTLLLLIIGSGAYIVYRNGWIGLLNSLVTGIFFAIIVGWIVSFLMRKAKK